MITLDTIRNAVRAVVVEVPGLGPVSLRPLTLADDRALAEADPAPEPPKKKDPTKGSLAPPVPNTDDPAYIAAFDGWYDRHTLLRIAAAMDYRTVDGRAWDHADPLPNRRAWANEAAHELETNLPAGVFVFLRKQLSGQTIAHALAETGEGNSGGGQTTKPGN